MLFGGATDLVHWGDHVVRWCGVRVQWCGAMVRWCGAMVRFNGTYLLTCTLPLYQGTSQLYHCTRPTAPFLIAKKRFLSTKTQVLVAKKTPFGSNFFGAVRWVTLVQQIGTMGHCTAPSHHCTVPSHHCTVPSHHCTVPSHHTRTMTPHHCTTYIVPLHPIIAPPFAPLNAPQRKALQETIGFMALGFR